MALFSSKSSEWGTPPDFFDALHREFAFSLDACALPQNAKCRYYFTPQQDGLKQRWRGACWCNPPYGREVGKWIEKAIQSAREGATVVCLLPARTDTRWWHEMVLPCATEIRFVRGLRFQDSGGRSSVHTARFASVLVVFRPPPQPERLVLKSIAQKQEHQEMVCRFLCFTSLTLPQPAAASDKPQKQRKPLPLRDKTAFTGHPHPKVGRHRPSRTAALPDG